MADEELTPEEQDRADRRSYSDGTLGRRPAQGEGEPGQRQLVRVLSRTLADAELPSPAPLIPRPLLAGAVLVVAAALTAAGFILVHFFGFFRNVYIFPILIFLFVGTVLEILIPAWSVVAGLRNERRGRVKRAAVCYRRALSRYLHGWIPLFRSPARILGIVLFIFKNDALELQPDDAPAVLADVRRAFERLQRVYGRFFGRLFKFFGVILDLLETVLTDRLDHLKADPEKGDLSNLDHLGRAMSLYQLGQVENAIASFDRAVDASEGSGETVLPEAARVLAAFAAWESGNLDECERRLRQMWPEDIDHLLLAISLECRLACSRGSPENAVTILEWIDSRIPAKGVDETTLTDLTLVRATALRMLEHYKEALPYASQAVAYYEQHGPIQASEARLEMTLSLDGLGRREEAVAVAARSAAELDTHRYQLENSSSRLTFAGANEKARALALKLTAVSAPRLAAELVEHARVQGLPTRPSDDRLVPAAPRALPGWLAKPRASGLSSATFSADDGARSAARTSAGLAPLTPPPRMDLFASGDSGLGRLAPNLPSTDHVVLAQVAEAVAGKEWWWWGSWEAGGQLYWSLIGHSGTVEAGAIRIASLEPFLTRLARALPTLLEEETAPANVARATSGAFAEPDATVALADELGALLIPPPLRDLALGRAASDQPLSLVVAPAPALGRVPFGLLGLGTDGVHLAHRAVVRLGASAALLEQIRRREQGQFRGRVLAVIDPCGRNVIQPSGEEATLSLLTDRELDQMGVIEWAWLQDRPLLSRSGHLPDLRGKRGTHLTKQATISELSKALRTTDADVLAYIGHVSNASDDMPANASLVLDDDDLSARDLLYDGNPRRWPIPSRAALLGCGSGGAQAPEWLGLAPASLWAGAQIVAATAWDLINGPDTWKLADEVVRTLLSPDPAAAWRECVMSYLAAWKSHTGPSPLSWGAIQFVGLGPERLHSPSG